jgi:hypothetical protein
MPLVSERMYKKRPNTQQQQNIGNADTLKCLSTYRQKSIGQNLDGKRPGQLPKQTLNYMSRRSRHRKLHRYRHDNLKSYYTQSLL